MSGIAQEIKDRLVPMMRSKGILLVVSRIVNFISPHNGKDKMIGIIANNKLPLGELIGKRKRTNKLADAKAIAEKDQQEARAYAEAQLLNSIAEALQKIHEINPQLSKQVIAMRYPNALQDYARNNTPEEEEKIQGSVQQLLGQTVINNELLINIWTKNFLFQQTPKTGRRLIQPIMPITMPNQFHAAHRFLVFWRWLPCWYTALCTYSACRRQQAIGSI